MGKETLPLVYACSGASNAAQLCNQVAIRLDREGRAAMSCIAGVGGDVPALVAAAKSGRKLIALDGCKLLCARNCLARHGITPDVQHNLADYGVQKRGHEFDLVPEELDRVFGIVAASLA